MQHDPVSVPYEKRASEIPFASAEYVSFASRNSFLGVPARRLDEIDDAGVVILGAPFDWGTTYRPGARFGP
ncbi:MAG: arginase family protein, partial [Acidimicrobiia bacterium]